MQTKVLRLLPLSVALVCSMAAILTLGLLAIRWASAGGDGPGASVSDPIHSAPLLGLSFEGYAVEEGRPVAVFNVTNREDAALHFQGCTVDIRSNWVWTTRPYTNINYFPHRPMSTPEEVQLWYTGENSLYPHRVGKIYFPLDELPDASARKVSTNQVWRLRLMCARQLIGTQLLPFKIRTTWITGNPKALLEKNTLGFSYPVDIFSEEIPLQ